MMQLRNPYRLVIRALPSDYRSEHGDELIDTALDLRDGRWSMRESALLLTHGMRTRAVEATGGSPRAAVSQAMMSTVELFGVGLVASVTTLLVTVWPRFSNFYVERWMIPLVAMTGVALVAKRPRLLIAAIAVLTFALNFGIRFPSSRDETFIVAFTMYPLLVVATGMWMLRDSAPRLHPARSLVLALVLSFVGIGFGSAALRAVVAIGTLGAIAGGLLLARWDPRPLLLAGCMVLWLEAQAWVFLLVNPSVEVPLWVWGWRVFVLALTIGLPWLAVRRLRLAI